MASEEDDQDFPNPMACDFARLLKDLDELRRRLEARDKLDRILGDFLRRVGKGQLDPNDAATRLQAAMEDRLVVAPVADRAAEGRNDGDLYQRIADAQRAVQRGNLQRAIEIYAELCVQYPDEKTRFRLKLGDCYARTGDIAQATEAYLEVAQHYDTQGLFLMAVAVYNLVLKLLRHSLTDAAVANRPNRLAADVHHALAGLYERISLLSDASLAYEEFLKYAEEADERIPAARGRIVELEHN